MTTPNLAVFALGQLKRTIFYFHYCVLCILKLMDVKLLLYTLENKV